MSSECQRKKPVSIFFTGLALFSMFFGAGNLVFPLVVGRSTGSEAPFAILGLGLSAVAFPFLGLIAAMFYKGNLKAFLERLGARPALILLFILYAAQGPFGSMPRLITLMHASVKPYVPDLSLLGFSLGISLFIFLLAFRPQKMVALLGVVLTPLLLLGLALLVGVGMVDPPPAREVFNTAPFLQGLKGGYQTMDLIAALLFATIIIPHLSQGTEELPAALAQKTMRKRMWRASLIAAGLLMATYIGLCLISAHYSAAEAVLPEDLLQTIAVRVLGPGGGIVAAVATFLACLTTAISLGVVFADYLRKELLKDRISSSQSLAITLIFTAAMANLGFGGIVRLFDPILTVLYPALIVLCFVNMVFQTKKLTQDRIAGIN